MSGKREAVGASSPIPKFAAFQITTKCNWHCYFCFSKRSLTDIPTEKCKKVIDNLSRAGVRIISLAGREPLLRDDVVEIADYIKKKDCEVVIETNGSLLTRKIINRFRADWISVSIDSLDREICEAIGRGFIKEREWAKIIANCKEIETKIKINTLISKKTAPYIERIGTFLVKNPPTIWKLRQYTPRERGTKYRDFFWIDTKDFLDITEKLKGKYPGLKIVTKTTAQQDSTCFMILPDGDIVMPTGETHTYMGNALKEDIAEVWQRSPYNKPAHLNNVERTYR